MSAVGVSPVAEPRRPDHDHGIIVVFHRAKGILASKIPVQVDINGKTMGVLLHHEVWQIIMPPGHVKLTAHGVKTKGLQFVPDAGEARDTEFELAANQTVIYAVNKSDAGQLHPVFVLADEDQMRHHMHKVPAVLTWPPAE